MVSIPMDNKISVKRIKLVKYPYLQTQLQSTGCAVALSLAKGTETSVSPYSEEGYYLAGLTEGVLAAGAVVGGLLLIYKLN